MHLIKQTAALCLIVTSTATQANMPFIKSASDQHCQSPLAPADITTMTINQRVDQHASTLTNGFASKGAIALRFDAAQQLVGTGAGSQHHQAINGLYNYHRLSANHGVEQSVDFIKGAYVTDYFFETANTGEYQQRYADGHTVLVGHFTLVPSQAAPLAPESISGLSVALTIKETQSNLPGGYPTSGMVVQRYDQTSYSAKGFGEGNIDSVGSYQYHRISANTAVETAVQTSAFFTLPYTMVYTFETENSGTWYQNFADGTIIFEGTFNTFH